MLLDSLWVNTGLIRKFECEILMIFKKKHENSKTLRLGGFFVCPPWYQYLTRCLMGAPFVLLSPSIAGVPNLVNDASAVELYY